MICCIGYCLWVCLECNGICHNAGLAAAAPNVAVLGVSSASRQNLSELVQLQLYTLVGRMQCPARLMLICVEDCAAHCTGCSGARMLTHS